MFIKSVSHKNQKGNIAFKILFFILALLAGWGTGWYWSHINFEKWQEKVAREALENIKLEQMFCDKAVQIINEKSQKIEVKKEDIITEYFDNIKNQLISLRETINKSKLTWKNIFPEEAKRIEELDSRVVKKVTDIKNLKNQIELLKIGYNKHKLDKREMEKLQGKIQKLNLKINSLEADIMAYKDIGSTYPSNVMSLDILSENIILPKGDIIDLLETIDLPMDELPASLETEKVLPIPELDMENLLTIEELLDKK